MRTEAAMEEKPVRRNYTISLVGVVFIVLGVALILNKMHLLPYRWDVIMWGSMGVYGLLVAALAFVTRRRGIIFLGSLMFFCSIAGILHKLYIVDSPPWDWFVIFSLILGCSFLVLFLSDPRRIGTLIPVILFGAYGVCYYLWWFDKIEWYDIQYYIRTYWPALLVLWGLSIVLRRK
jgi:uncharacterized membrane protein HdeD (DUF308 family)